MREYVIKCDRCGKVIEGTPTKMFFSKMSRDGQSTIETERKTVNWDFCDICMEDILEYAEAVKDSGKILETSILNVDEWEAALEPKRADSPKLAIVPKTENQKTVKELDEGKIRSLFGAGWTLKNIAEEVGCAPSTVLSRLKKMGLKK